MTSLLMLTVCHHKERGSVKEGGGERRDNLRKWGGDILAGINETIFVNCSPGRILSNNKGEQLSHSWMSREILPNPGGSFEHPAVGISIGSIESILAP
jgi:hypothetical protein